MIPTLVRTPFHYPGWVYEEKVDGYRMLAYKDRARVRLVSRRGIEHTHRYPDLAAAIARLTPATLVLDGELAVFDQFSCARALTGFDFGIPPNPQRRRCSSLSTFST